MKAAIVLLALILAACGKPSDNTSTAIASALSCTPGPSNVLVMYPDGLNHASNISECSDGCDHDVVIGNPKMTLVYCSGITLQSAPL